MNSYDSEQNEQQLPNRLKIEILEKLIQNGQPPYRVCLALAIIKLAISAFIYLYNDETNEIEVCEALQPLTHDTHLEGDCYQGQMAFKHKKLTLTLNFTPSQVNVALDSQYLAIKKAKEDATRHQGGGEFRIAC